MIYTYRFSATFSNEFPNFPQDQQDKILDFLDIYEAHGLADRSRYPGKITHSWNTLLPSHPNYNHAKQNDLWHYHIGLPSYTVRPHGRYKTSDWVLHFRWPHRGTHIDIVDLYTHNKSDGTFYLPPSNTFV